MKQMALFLLVAVSLAHATTKCYEVVPFSNCIGMTDTFPPSENQLTQYFRMTLDSVTMFNLWVGDAINTDSFRIEIRDSAISAHRVAWNPGVSPTGSWSWLEIPLLPDPVYKPIRGRTYKVTVTRQDGTAIDGWRCPA